MMFDRHNVTLTGLVIAGFYMEAISLGVYNPSNPSECSSNCVITNNTITGGTSVDVFAIWAEGNNNTYSNNVIVQNNGDGIVFDEGTGNVVENNYIADNNGFGVSIEFAHIVFRNNQLNNNTDGAFDFLEGTYSCPAEDIDSSNLVDGKPVCYMVDQHNMTVPTNAGYVMLLNCTGISVRGLSVPASQTKYNSDGITLSGTTDTVIADNSLEAGTGIIVRNYDSQEGNINITDNTLSAGISLVGSGISVVGNTLTETGLSISSNTFVAENTFTNCNAEIVAASTFSPCEAAIAISGDNNTIAQNNIVRCATGIWLFDANNNRIYHNNFINNTIQAYIEHYGGSPEDMYIFHTYFPSLNDSWDAGYPAGGNYWSDYNGTDTNHDGIGDSPYHVLDNYTDRYPLMAPIDINQQIFTSPPIVNLLSPQNKTYGTGKIEITFTVTQPAIWYAYSLDGQANVTVAGNTTLTGIPVGVHSIVIIAVNRDGYLGESEAANFTVAPQTEASRLGAKQSLLSLPVTFAISSITVAVVVCAVLVLQLRKRALTKREIAVSGPASR
jgi:parallel beta-helix repeat protein